MYYNLFSNSLKGFCPVYTKFFILAIFLVPQIGIAQQATCANDINQMWLQINKYNQPLQTQSAFKISGLSGGSCSASTNVTAGKSNQCCTYCNGWTPNSERFWNAKCQWTKGNWGDTLTVSNP